MSKQDERIKKNIENSHKASAASRYKKSGLTDQKAKLNSKNFDKLMEQRGLSKQSRAELKASAEKGSQMQVRHAKAGEKFITTHGTERSSGVFVTEKSLGKTAEERINKGALPHSNSAEYETKVELSKDQNIIYSKIAAQSKFSKMDPKQTSRNGGGEQVITDGGYNAGAVSNKDAKYPVPVNNEFQKRASEYKSQQSTRNSNNSNVQRGSKQSNSQPKGQSM